MVSISVIKYIWIEVLTINKAGASKSTPQQKMKS